MKGSLINIFFRNRQGEISTVLVFTGMAIIALGILVGSQIRNQRITTQPRAAIGIPAEAYWTNEGTSSTVDDRIDFIVPGLPCSDSTRAMVRVYDSRSNNRLIGYMTAYSLAVPAGYNTCWYGSWGGKPASAYFRFYGTKEQLRAKGLPKYVRLDIPSQTTMSNEVDLGGAAPTATPTPRLYECGNADCSNKMWNVSPVITNLNAEQICVQKGWGSCAVCNVGYGPVTIHGWKPDTGMWSSTCPGSALGSFNPTKMEVCCTTNVTPTPTRTPTPTPRPTLFCNDTDGGLNYTVKGSVTGNGSGCGNIPATDLCATSSVLNEMHCGSSKQCFTSAYTCPGGCSNGVCLPTKTPTPTATRTPTPSPTKTPTRTPTPTTATSNGQITATIWNYQGWPDTHKIVVKRAPQNTPANATVCFSDTLGNLATINHSSGQTIKRIQGTCNGLVNGSWYYFWAELTDSAGTVIATSKNPNGILDQAPLVDTGFSFTLPTAPTTPPVCPLRSKGDANCDGVINSTDYTCWMREYLDGKVPAGTSCKTANFDNNQMTDLIDFTIWKINRSG